MRYATLTIILALLLAGSVLAAGSAPALAVDGAVSVSGAHVKVHAAALAVARAEARLREAKHVESATRLYSGIYGAAVGRWVWAARRVGWQWSDIPTLMLVVHTESGGDPNAFSGYYAGLLQFGPDWWSNRWNPYHGPTSLAHGKRAHDANGWTPWPWVN